MCLYHSYLISILAPAWGASYGALGHTVGVIPFQFSPPRGGRPIAALHKSQKCQFQFSPPRGGRLLFAVSIDLSLISILAPAWGASVAAPAAFQLADISILAPAWGASWREVYAATGTIQFQFSPPRGGRPEERSKATAAKRYFNSRPRVGGVTTSNYTLDDIIISILAPAWGASLFVNTYRDIFSYFNSRPRVGGVHRLRGLGQDCRISILAPAWGASRGINVKYASQHEFQFSPPRGGRPSLPRQMSEIIVFQFSPPRGGRPATLRSPRSASW